MLGFSVIKFTYGHLITRLYLIILMLYAINAAKNFNEKILVQSHFQGKININRCDELRAASISLK